jgi:hypothetical protein
MILTLTFVVFALGAWAVYAAHKHAQFTRATLERLHALEQKQAHLDEVTDKMGHEWASIFAGQQKAWGAHIERVTDAVATKLSFEAPQRNKKR